MMEVSLKNIMKVQCTLKDVMKLFKIKWWKYSQTIRKRLKNAIVVLWYKQLPNNLKHVNKVSLKRADNDHFGGWEWKFEKYDYSLIKTETVIISV